MIKNNDTINIIMVKILQNKTRHSTDMFSTDSKVIDLMIFIGIDRKKDVGI